MGEVLINQYNNVLKGVLSAGYYNLSPAEKICKYNKPEKLQNYFYKIEYEDYDYEDGYRYVEELLKKESLTEQHANFACSSLRKGDYTIRSFDWLYNESPNFFIRTKATRGKFATIGSAFALSKFTAEMVDTGRDWEYYKYLPFFTVDVLNEKGVYINNNVVTPRDAGQGIPTDQNTGKQRMCQLMIVRYLGDYATSARHAVELMKSVDAFAPLKIMNYETHFMICDEVDSFIVEYVDNELKVVSMEEGTDYIPMPNNLPIMTNFYEYAWNGDVKAYYRNNSTPVVKATGLTAHSCGLERYLILRDEYDKINSIDTAKEAISKVAYTNTYKDKECEIERWYSEFTGETAERDVNIWDTDKEVFRGIFNHAKEVYDEGRGMKRDGKFWISSHSSVYDLKKKVMCICSEEHYDTWYRFKLDTADDSGGSLEDLEDVEFTDLEKDDFISYDEDSGKWRNIDFPLEMKVDEDSDGLLEINIKGF